MDIPIFIPTCSVSEFLYFAFLLHLICCALFNVANSACVLVFRHGTIWHSLTVNVFERFSFIVSVLLLSSVNCLFQRLAHFSIGLSEVCSFVTINFLYLLKIHHEEHRLCQARSFVSLWIRVILTRLENMHIRKNKYVKSTNRTL